MITKKKPARLAAAILSVMMVFAFMPLITGPAYADDGATVIKTSEITDDMLSYRADKGYLKVGQDTILYIDSDITLHGVTCNDREYHYDTSTQTGTWTGSYYDLTIQGDGEHTLNVIGDINGENALRGVNIYFESGNVNVTLDEVNDIRTDNDFYMKGGSLTVNAPNSTWTPFNVKHKLIVSGGTLTEINTDTGGVNAALYCGHFEMTGGKVKAETEDGAGISAVKNSADSDMDGNFVMSGGKLTVAGEYYGVEVGGMFVMTGGYVSGATKKTDANYAPGIDFGINHEPVIGGGIGITAPVNGVIKQFDKYSNPWYVADEDGNVAALVVLQPLFTETTVSLSATSYTYNGKVKTPTVTVKDGKKVLTKDTDYTVTYADGRKNAGKYTVKVRGKGIYSTDAQVLTFTIKKAKNPMVVTGKTPTVKYSKVKKAAQKLLVSKVLKFSKKAQGTVTYTKAKGNGKITIAKKTGKVTVKKGLKKGTYSVKVKVKAEGTKNYKALTKTVTFKIKVK